MNEQQLIKTIEDQNQVIIAKDATIDNLRKRIDDANRELNGLYIDRAYKKMHNEWGDRSHATKVSQSLWWF